MPVMRLVSPAIPLFVQELVNFNPQKKLQTHGCVISTVATDDLVLKHQVISIHSADCIFTVLDRFHRETLHLQGKILQNKNIF